MDGNCPALLGLPALENLKGTIDVVNRKLYFSIGYDEYVADLYRTDSRHLILPTDNFKRSLPRYRYSQNFALFNTEEELEAVFSNPPAGLMNSLLKSVDPENPWLV